jgi:pilus assembly protein FimV
MKRNRFSLSIIAAAVCLSSIGAHAAGLGKITVLSPLGQPLRAELDVTATRDELASMSAKLASPEAFKQVGIEYLPAFAGIRFVLDKRADGQPFLRVITDRPVNEPFLDILIELTWASGRMVREYTMLLDPPDVFSKSAPAPVALPESKPVQREAVTAPAKEPVIAPAPASVKPEPTPLVEKAEQAPAKAVPPAKPVQPAAKAAPGVATRVIKAGDTLSKIAEENRTEGVSLDQMLVALFRSNQDAFSGQNMNRLKAGKILSIPEADTVTAIAPTEARKTVLAQARDFNAYRRKLAAAVAATPVKEAPVKQQDTGRIAPKVEEKVPEPAPSKDKLEVSRTETAKDGKGVQRRIDVLEEDLVSRDKSLKEAGTRVAELEKNLADLKKLAEMKSQVGAQMQEQAQAVKPGAEGAAPAVAKTAEATAANPPAEVKAADKPMDVAAAPPPKTEEAPKVPAAAKPQVAPVPSTPPASQESSFVDENPELVYGGGGLVALLLGWLGYSAWRRRPDQGAEALHTGGNFSEGELTANSVFGSTGGQSVNTGASIQTDFSQANLTSIDAEEGVDPVAEADVYMAYGRDAQAEEILLDALKHDPARHAVYLKLLEVYFGRKDAKQFESVARNLLGRTGGAGPDWNKATEMGRALDPDNTLYAADGGAVIDQVGGAIASELDSQAVAAPSDETRSLHNTVALPGHFAQMASAAESAATAQPAAIDFELDLGPVSDTEQSKAPELSTVPTTLDFDLGLNLDSATSPPVSSQAGEAAVSLAGIETRQVPFAKPAESKPGDAGVDFEFDLDIPAATNASTDATVSQPAAFDLSAIDLDLGAPAASGDATGDADNPDVATKLELALAYEEMGDSDGARELLQEVMKEGSARQQGVARDKLAALSA